MANTHLRRYSKQEIAAHMLFWLGYFILLTSLFADLGDIRLIMLRNLITCIFQASLVYLNIWYLIPWFFVERRYVKYYLSIVAAIGLITPIRMMVDHWLLTDTAQLAVEFYTLPHVANIILSGVIILFVSSSLRYRELQYKSAQAAEVLRSSQLEAELRFLQTQINPHFLFNVLNNLYALAYTGSKETAPMIMKLSEMMRYMLYTSDNKRVPLHQEVKYLRNFIDLQQMKMSTPMNIVFDIEGNGADISVPPMLLIPLFENSFKHGNVEDLEKGFVKSELKIEGSTLNFFIRNSVSGKVIENIDKVGGIGLENVKKRLLLLFPKKHTFEVDEGKDFFEVRLTIDTAL